MNTKDLVQQIVSQSVVKAIADGKIPEGDYPEIKIEYPREEKFGDYSTPFALESAKILKRSPIETGNIIKEYLESNDLFEKVDVVKPGFINMFLSLDHLYENLKNIIEHRDDYGKSTKEKPENINIEFVSANPTGPMNVVSARAAALGDTLANILEFSGDKVDKEFYVNDYGNQVNLLGKSVRARLDELNGKDSDFPEDGYHGEYIKDIAKHINENFAEQVKEINDESQLIEFLASKAVEYNVGGQKKDLEEFNVNFDVWFHEKELHNADKVKETFEYMEKQGAIYEEDGKKVFRATDYKDDKDRVVIREDGRPTYLMADIAYHKNKMDRGYDRLMNIWGPDHHGYITRLRGAVSSMGFDVEKFNVLIAQQVNLIMEGETVKMSKRLGKFSTMRELIDEIGVDVARYFFIMRSMDSHLDFDLALAKKESSENPVFYLQYAHARICSIFNKAENEKIAYKPEISKVEPLNNPEAIKLSKYLHKFPEEVKDAAEAFEPHRICTYLMKLAQAFHKFYTEHKVLTDDEVKTSTYLLLADSVRTVMKIGLSLLGVNAPERM